MKSMKKFNTITIKGEDSEGTPSKTIITVTENDTILVKQRLFVDEEHESARTLRTWKGMYYVQRHVHMLPETYENVLKAVTLIKNQQI